MSTAGVGFPRSEWKPLLAGLAVFAALYLAPADNSTLARAILEAVGLARWYAREHVILCLVPAFFIAGAVAVFASRAAVMKYLGAGANKVVAYSVGAVSGSVLTVCSCTVLPIFAGIYKRGAGLGPATAFLYSGPAINVLAVILTARILGLELGAARALGAVLFSVVIGLCMHGIFRREEAGSAGGPMLMPEEEHARGLGRTGAFLGALLCILVFANWARPVGETGFWHAVFALKWWLTGISGIALLVVLVAWFGLSRTRAIGLAAITAVAIPAFPGQPLVPFVVGAVGLSVVTGTSRGAPGEWFASSWGFARQIFPLLLLGVLAAGLLLGRPGSEGLIPSDWITRAVGGNSLRSNLLASVAGAFMYFATLTEVPILQGLLAGGMGKGPALALLLAGPALSLPNLLVIRSVMGTRKTLAYLLLVVVMATVAGVIFGSCFNRE